MPKRLDKLELHYYPVGGKNKGVNAPPVRAQPVTLTHTWPYS